MRIPVLIIILLFVITVCVDAYILYDIRSYGRRHNRKKLSWTFILISFALLALPIVGLSLPVRSEHSGVLPVIWLLFSYATILIPALIYCLFSIIGRLINFRSRRLVNYGAMLGVPVGIVVCLVMWWGVLVTRNRLEVRDVAVESSRVPRSFNGYKIVQFSDAHVGTWGNDTAFVSRLVDRINGLSPDMIVFTGDLVNRESMELKPFVRVLGRLRAKDGVYSVMGNHDYGDYISWDSDAEKQRNLTLIKEWQKKMGWTILDNSHVFVHRDGDSIAVVGVENWGEPPFKQYGDLHKAFAEGRGKLGMTDDNFKVLLSHNPQHWSREVRDISNVDLTLSGHTHAMQMEFDIVGRRFSPAVWRYPEWGGMYDWTSKDKVPMQLYVNIGAGEVGMPMRIGATPEITNITLRSSN